MPGMNSGLNIHDPLVVSSFHAALLHQGLIALAIFALLSIGWVAVRGPGTPGGTPAVPVAPEARSHQVLRIGFGLLWLLDGLLQAQSGMAAGLPSQVIEPSATSSPHWVQHLVSWAGTGWSYHPVQAAAAAVWIQIGIGLWLLAAPRGRASRLGGLASVAWGLVVWVFGEAFGGIFAPALTWLFGAPGAAAVYVVAGGLLALPARAWLSPRLGRAVLGGLGLFLAGMTVLQAWPGRGFWGTTNGSGGTLAGMVQQMSVTSQPHAIAALVSGFAAISRAHSFTVNLIAVLVMGGVVAVFLAGAVTGRRDITRPALGVFLAFALADWVLVEDLGFFGGLGTDPNSMIPFALLAVTGYLALVPGTETAPAAETAAPLPWPDWRGRLRTATFGTMTSAGALGVIVLGVVPLATAQASPAASPVLAESIDGPAAPVNIAAGDFTLTDQHGHQVSLSGLRGKVVLLTFLDPVCVSDCPLIAQEFRQAGQMLGMHNPHVELVAVNVNPLYHQAAYIQAFDRQEHLASAPDWEYLTGDPATLRKIYKEYGVPAETLPAGAMLGHNDTAYVINQRSEITEQLDLDPGPGTAATESSFATELAEAVNKTLATP
jgi:cytochrome oxidase Cu insertion factor (SCO1/SenC/PrrC family)